MDRAFYEAVCQEGFYWGVIVSGICGWLILIAVMVSK